MKTEIIQFEPEHGLAIFRRNIVERRIRPSNNLDLDQLFKTWKNGGPSYTLTIDGEIVFCAGVVLMGWQRGEAWTLLSSLFFIYKKTCYKAIKKYLEIIAKNNNLRRVQSFTMINANGTENFMKHLGFEKEGIAHRFSSNGEDVVQYWRGFEWTQQLLQVSIQEYRQ